MRHSRIPLPFQTLQPLLQSLARRVDLKRFKNSPRLTWDLKKCMTTTVSQPVTATVFGEARLAEIGLSTELTNISGALYIIYGALYIIHTHVTGD